MNTNPILNPFDPAALRLDQSFADTVGVKKHLMTIPVRARPALVAHKIRAMQLQAGQPEKKGNKGGAAYAYNIKELCNREIDVARHAEHAYEQFVSRWQRRGPAKRRTGAANEERR